MQTTKFLLVLILSVITLSSCATPTGLQNFPPSTEPKITMPPTGVILPSKTPSPPATETPTRTTVVKLNNTPTATQLPQPTTTPITAVPSGACQLEPVSQPPWPTDSLQPNERDPKTGLHVTGKPQLIDLATYRLKVTGLVNNPLSLTYDDLRCMRKVTDSPELICPQVFIDEATWTGVPIKDVLELAGVQPGAKKVTLVSADGYEFTIPLDTAIGEKNFLAYKVNGVPLPVRHGFPLRAVFPSMWGSYWIKWLIEIRIS